MNKLLLMAAIAFLLASGLATRSGAQSADPAWLDQLNFQMERDEQCEVAYYIRLKEGELGGETTYEARLQCVDGRQFDATRLESDLDFKITRCEVETC